MFRFPFYFIISYVILSVPVSNQKLFYYIDSVTAPILKPMYSELGSKVSSHLHEAKNWVFDFLDNSIGSDDVSTSYAAPVKEKSKNAIKKPDELDRKSEIYGVEYYSDEEIAQLEAMLRDSKY